MGPLIRKNQLSPLRRWRSDHSRSSTLGSSGAPPGRPGAVLTGAGSVCMMATLLPIRSASQRKHVSDLLAMVGDNTETVHAVPRRSLGPESWPLGRALLHMGGLGIMFDMMRRQSGGCRRHQRCLRDGHREHGGHLLATAEAVYGQVLYDVIKVTSYTRKQYLFYCNVGIF